MALSLLTALGSLLGRSFAPHPSRLLGMKRSTSKCPHSKKYKLKVLKNLYCTGFEMQTAVERKVNVVKPYEESC
jgi:hypothetical protein